MPTPKPVTKAMKLEAQKKAAELKAKQESFLSDLRASIPPGFVLMFVEDSYAPGQGLSWRWRVRKGKTIAQGDVVKTNPIIPNWEEEIQKQIEKESAARKELARMEAVVEEGKATLLSMLPEGSKVVHYNYGGFYIVKLPNGKEIQGTWKAGDPTPDWANAQEFVNSYKGKKMYAPSDAPYSWAKGD